MAAPIVNGSWQKWVMGIGATVAGSLIINGIVFQREARKDIAENNVKILQLQQRDENIIKYIALRLDERLREAHTELIQRDMLIQRLERRLDELEKRR
jgi:hypothetical protein